MKNLFKLSIRAAGSSNRWKIDMSFIIMMIAYINNEGI